MTFENLSETEFDKRVHSVIEGRSNNVGILRRLVRKRQRAVEAVEASSGIIYQIK